MYLAVELHTAYAYAYLLAVANKVGVQLRESDYALMRHRHERILLLLIGHVYWSRYGDKYGFVLVIDEVIQVFGLVCWLFFGFNFLKYHGLSVLLSLIE